MTWFEPRLIAELMLLGAGVGVLAGLLGIGGGMIMVPLLTILLDQRGVAPGLAVKMAIATSMATILFTSLASVRAHHQRGAVRWDIVRAMAPGIVIGGLVAGAGVFALVKGLWLALGFALLISISATQMLIGRKPQPGRELPGTLGTTAAGAVIGLLAGLVGVGGAFVSVPFMTRGNVPIHQAVATSAALGFPIALANTTGYVIGGWSLPTVVAGGVGYLWLPALLFISLASVGSAPLGARLAHSLDIHVLRRIFAVMLYLLAGYMAWKALNA